MQKPVTALAVLLLLAVVPRSAAAQGSLDVTSTDGGSVTTPLAYGIAVNKSSSLRRQWFLINDPTCPLNLVGAGINTAYGDRDYSFKAAGTVFAKEGVSAFEVRFMVFDVWGEHMKTLSGTELRDLAAGTYFALADLGSWRAWETEVEQYVTSVGFVARVRTADGRAWSIDTAALLRELGAVKLRLTQEQLAPVKRQEP